MEILKPTFEILEQGNNIEGLQEIIEKAGRTCYKSEDKITNGSAERFTNAMVKNNHTAMLEHGTVYLTIPWTTYPDANMDITHYLKKPVSKYSTVNYGYDEKGDVKEAYITTNYRVIVENNLFDDLKYQTEPTPNHEKRITIKFKMDRVGTQSCERHRVFSFAQESTRYCNYGKDKFGNGINISQPHFIKDEDILKTQTPNYNETIKGVHEEYMGNNSLDFSVLDYWFAANSFCEFCYLKLLEKGLNAEDARSILPLDLNSEMVMTGFICDWIHWLDLRADNKTGKAHPDIHEIAVKVKEELLNKNLIK